MDTIRRQRRHAKIRARIHGSAERPRACVRRSLRHIAVQLIDDDAGATLLSLSSVVVGKNDKRSKTEQATLVGQELAKQAAQKNISSVVFDRGGYRYHGRVKALAEGMREGGLQF